MLMFLRRTALGSAVVVCSLAAATLPAQAAVPNSFCSDKSYTYLVKTYERGGERLALRCGTRSWGFNHVTQRWSSTFDSEIALTIARGERVTDEQGDGGSAIFSLRDSRCNELFRVVYNGRAYNGNGVSPQGIITAYEVDPVTTTALQDSLAASDSSGYRTDCEVDQNI